jgi:hypothetical protein
MLIAPGVTSPSSARARAGSDGFWHWSFVFVIVAGNSLEKSSRQLDNQLSLFKFSREPICCDVSAVEPQSGSRRTEIQMTRCSSHYDSAAWEVVTSRAWTSGTPGWLVERRERCLRVLTFVPCSHPPTHLHTSKYLRAPPHYTVPSDPVHSAIPPATPWPAPSFALHR